MDQQKPSRLSNLRELVALLSLSVQIQGESAAIFEDLECRIYSLEEDRKRLIADYRALQTRCNSLEKRYSELLYKLSDLKKGS